MSDAPGGLPSTPTPRDTDASIPLPLGKALDIKQASLITRSGFTPLIVLAGSARSGKTTLISSLYEQFQWGTAVGYLFAGSQTLLGFEQKCFDSRVASGADDARTSRTSFSEGQHFFHLSLKKNDADDSSKRKAILLADMSGEYYSNLINERASVEDMAILRRADHFVLLVNGPMLFSETLHTKIRSNALMILRRCIELQLLGKQSRVDVLLTKWDVVRALYNDRAISVLELTTEIFLRNAHKFRRMRVLPVAARPIAVSQLPLGWGLEEVFKSWFGERPSALDVGDVGMDSYAVPPGVASPFDRYGIQNNPELFKQL